MSVFDLFRGFFGVPGGQRGRRDPFFEAMTHDDDDEDDEEDGFSPEGFQGDQPDFDGLRFGFSFGPDGLRIQEPPMFGHFLREMEEMFSQMGRWDGQKESELFGAPDIMTPPSQDRIDKGGGGGASGNPLRDFMFKSPDQGPRGAQPGPSREPPRHHDLPFSRFHDIWRQGPERPTRGSQRQDGDLDSDVSSEGLDKILTPPAGETPNQPRVRSFFQSVSISKVVKPDGTVEERRTVRDSQGNEETTVTRSGGPGVLEGPEDPPVPVLPGGRPTFSDLRDDDSLFSRFFGGFK